MNDKPTEEWLTLAEAELIVGVPADEIRLWITRGVRMPNRKLFRLTSKRERHRLYVTEAALREFVEQAAARRTAHPQQWPAERQQLARSLVGRVKQPA